VSGKQPAANVTKASNPGFIEPELSTSGDKVPSGARWIREIEFNGYPVQLHLGDATVKVSLPPTSTRAAVR
jgi:bifunctional non-homologous end joining protein LigD